MQKTRDDHLRSVVVSFCHWTIEKPFFNALIKCLFYIVEVEKAHAKKGIEIESLQELVTEYKDEIQNLQSRLLSCGKRS